MSGGRTKEPLTAANPLGAPAPPRPKILVCVTEDWFALSHFQPLIRALVRFAREVVVVTRSSGRTGELEALGARVVAFDFQRSSANPLKGWQAARGLGRIIAGEEPDAVHLISLKPIVTGALALAGNAKPAVAVHLTGLGLLAIARSPTQNALRYVALNAMRRLLRRNNSWLFLENPEDLAIATATAAASRAKTTILGGAGVDIDHFAAAPPTSNTQPVAACVGRLIHSKGIDVLVDAARLLRARRVDHQLDLYGKIDEDNPEAYTERQIRSWQGEGLVSWHGHVDDVRTIWRKSDIFVMATRGGEGMPRAMLEAAACGRPLIVTDVPGCRHFVRNGQEGLVVAPGDATALADALARLAADAPLRRALGLAARARVASGYTEAHVETALIDSYRQLLSP